MNLFSENHFFNYLVCYRSFNFVRQLSATNKTKVKEDKHADDNTEHEFIIDPVGLRTNIKEFVREERAENNIIIS